MQIAKSLFLLLFVCVVPPACSASPTSPASVRKLAKRVLPPGSVSVGTVSTDAAVRPTNMLINPDGFVVQLDVLIGGAHRSRVLSVSLDGRAFAIDGVVIKDPPKELRALGEHLAAMVAKMVAALQHSAVAEAVTRQ